MLKAVVVAACPLSGTSAVALSFGSGSRPAANACACATPAAARATLRSGLFTTASIATSVMSSPSDGSNRCAASSGIGINRGSIATSVMRSGSVESVPSGRSRYLAQLTVAAVSTKMSAGFSMRSG
jgi:hypothetical protein